MTSKTVEFLHNLKGIEQILEKNTEYTPENTDHRQAHTHTHVLIPGIRGEVNDSISGHNEAVRPDWMRKG